MKKALPYIILVIVVLLIGGLFIATNKKPQHVMDERITLKQRDKIPYGTSAAKTLLPTLFRNSSVYYDNQSPGNWDSLLSTSNNQAVILVAKNFDADEGELNRLVYFAQQGNYVFIIAKSFSYNAIRLFNFSYNENQFDSYLNVAEDSLEIKLEKPSFASDRLFVYPGKKYETFFNSVDTAHTIILGRNKENNPDFIQFKTGNGSIFIHTAPLAFSNYFILHKNNVQYFQDALSVVPSTIDKIVWNEYYLTKPSGSEDKEPGWFRVLMRYPAFKWGLLMGIFMLALYMLLEMRRKQRVIPPYQKPVNDSLDFVKTLGRLYYDKQDHENLAKKMAVYFLDHVRSRYKLSTHTLDETFIQSLHYKSGYPLKDLGEIISYINILDNNPPVSENQLAYFHKQLELFYQNT